MRLADESRRARAFTWNVALLIGSSAVWTVLAGALPERAAKLSATSGFSGTQLVLLGSAAITALAFICYWPLRLPRETGRAHLTRPAALPREVRSLIPSVAFWMLATALVAPFFNVFFADRFTMPVRSIGALFAISHVVTAAALVGAAEIARRWGPQRALGWWILAFAPSLWCLAAVDLLPGAVGLFMIVGLIPPATNPLIDQLVLERVEQRRHGVVAAWRNAAAEASGALGASAGGYLLAATSFGTLLMTAGTVGAIAGLLLIAILRSDSTARTTESMVTTH
jgi:predicted MFS family arabinose efflux permease